MDVGGSEGVVVRERRGEEVNAYLTDARVVPSSFGRNCPPLNIELLLLHQKSPLHPLLVISIRTFTLSWWFMRGTYVCVEILLTICLCQPRKAIPIHFHLFTSAKAPSRLWSRVHYH